MDFVYTQDHKCMAHGCPGRDATSVLRIDFAFFQRGHRNVTHVAYLEVCVCTEHATPANAETFKNDDLKALGSAICQVTHKQLLWDNTTIKWVPKEESVKFFQRVEEHAAKIAAQRRSSIMDAANDTLQ